MDVKIGIADNGRELTVTVTEAPQEVEKLVAAALAGESALNLVDDKGRRVIVPSARIAYVEMGPADGRRVGFGS